MNRLNTISIDITRIIRLILLKVLLYAMVHGIIYKENIWKNQVQYGLVLDFRESWNSFQSKDR